MTQWILIYIALTYHGHPIVEVVGSYDKMIQCFDAREKLSIKLGSDNGYYPVNTQAICIQHVPENK